jgi:hypothetical protein
VKFVKPRGSSDQGGVTRELARKHRRGELESIGIQGLTRQGFTPRRIANRDSPNLSAPLFWTETRGAGSLRIGVRRSAFPEARVQAL